MEVALSLRNFSFYTSSETVYLRGTVFQKIDLEPVKEVERHFQNVKTNTAISLRLKTFDPEVVNLLLTHRILKIRSTEILPLDTQGRITFVADSVQKCGI